MTALGWGDTCYASVTVVDGVIDSGGCCLIAPATTDFWSDERDKKTINTCRFSFLRAPFSSPDVSATNQISVGIL